ncbi:hypothetical protein Gogos_001092 [Gossypium gossypioides]|uniref:Uncharacterized protein n=1 Tax=Gossypium gossypioides TaxID=34282 RepID=A0A7J9CV49_GOSGO|nr:hypothetical protein [Gossypium gossypioides]
MQRRIYGRSTHTLIRTLNKEAAVQAAAFLLGELFIFAVSECVSMCSI